VAIVGLADRKIRKLETKGDVEGLIKCLGRRPTGGLARDALADLGAEATLEPLLAALGDESESDETRSGAAETWVCSATAALWNRCSRLSAI